MGTEEQGPSIQEMTHPQVEVFMQQWRRFAMLGYTEVFQHSGKASHNYKGDFYKLHNMIKHKKLQHNNNIKSVHVRNYWSWDSQSQNNFLKP